MRKTLHTIKSFFSGITIKRLVVKARVVRIILGAGGTSYPGWISTDYPTLDVTDEKSWHRLFQALKIDALLAEHVFEHLTDNQIVAAFANAYRFLKIGGYIRIAVPDGYHPDTEYIEMVKPGGKGPGSKDHKQLFNYQTLSDQLEKAGFVVRLLEWFDEQGTFNFQEWKRQDGFISRSSRYDERNTKIPLSYTSLILDAHKP